MDRAIKNGDFGSVMEHHQLWRNRAEEAVILAIKHEQVEILEWFVDVGYPLTDKVMQAAIDYDDAYAYDLLLENGYPETRELMQRVSDANACDIFSRYLPE